MCIGPFQVSDRGRTYILGSGCCINDPGTLLVARLSVPNRGNRDAKPRRRQGGSVSSSAFVRRRNGSSTRVEASRQGAG